MTVQTTVSRADYSCNGVTQTFTVPFYFIQSSHIQVLLTTSAGVSSTLALGSDYSVSGAGDSSGGSITTTVAYATGNRLTILRNVPLTQLTAYPTNGPFPAASHERALDQLTMEVQQLNEAVDRAVTLPPATTGVDTALPVPVANDFLAWNSSGTGLTNIDPTSLLTVAASSGFAYNTFTGDGSTTAFTLSASPGAIANLVVAIGGVLQTPSVDYTLSGAQLTFATAPANGVAILARWGQTLGIGIPSDTSVSTAKIADGAVTTAKIADSAVTAAKVANGVAAANLGAGGVTSSLLAAGAATLAKLDTTGAAGKVLTAQGAGSAPIWSDLPSLPAPVRNTVQTGAAILAAGSGLSVSLKASAFAVCATVAAGYNTAGQLDYPCRFTSDQNDFWTGLVANTTNYLFIDRNPATGALTGAASTLPYSVVNASGQLPSSVASTANGQHTYVADAGLMYVGNGSQAVLVQRVPVGECTTGAATVTAVAQYAFNRKYDSGLFLVGPSTAYTKTHLMGTVAYNIDVTMADDSSGTNERPATPQFVSGANAFGWYGGTSNRAASTVITVPYVGESVSNVGVTTAYYRVRARGAF